MTHEYWFTLRESFCGSTPYYKVLGANSWTELKSYYDQLSPEDKKQLSPIQYNGAYALHGKKENYTD